MSVRHQIVTLKNDLAEITRLAEFVDSFCQPLKPSQKEMFSLHLALEEIVTNVINHGYRDGQQHSFTVELKATPQGHLTAVVTDDAPAFDPLARPAVDTSLPVEQRPIGGLGIHLIKAMMNSVRYERSGDKNIITLDYTMVPPS